MTTKISVDDFARYWKNELDGLKISLPEFVENVLKNSSEHKTYADWIETWVAWAELSTKEDIEKWFGF